MTDSQTHSAPTGAARPVHLWIVGVVSLLWNSFGCYDYLMTKLDPVGYLGGMGLSPAAMAYMTSLPVWLNLFWATGVWTSLLGSVLLLMRSRHAVPSFAISFAAFVISQVAEAKMPRPPEMASPAMLGMVATITVVLIALFLYSRRQAANGVLR